ncbi:MAG: PsiF family protein [Methylovirgula sp.]|nr:PsiF family protein [Methylovirgula sp.]
MTKILSFALMLSLIAGAASAQMATCHSRAAEKNLHGAALTSFMKKCEKDAHASCDLSAADKKLHGAAKTSFTKKCVNDAVGS